MLRAGEGLGRHLGLLHQLLRRAAVAVPVDRRHPRRPEGGQGLRGPLGGQPPHEGDGGAEQQRLQLLLGAAADGELRGAPGPSGQPRQRVEGGSEIFAGVHQHQGVGVRLLLLKGVSALGAVPVQAGDNGPAAPAPGGGRLPGPLLPQQQPVAGHPADPAQLGHVCHVRVCLAALPLAHRLAGDAQPVPQLLLGQPGLLAGQGDAFS